MGWVIRDYNNLIAEASKLGIKSPENYYDEGKKNGRFNRDRGIDGQKSKENIETTAIKTGVKTPQKNEMEFNDAKKVYHPMKRSSLSDLPRVSERIRVSEIPKLLNGLKFLIRK